MNSFLFEHAGGTGVFAWLKYKAKESFLLARMVVALLGAQALDLAIHNSVSSKRHITTGFLSERADGYFDQNIELVNIIPQSALTHFIATVLAIILFISPIFVMCRLVSLIFRTTRPRARSVLVFCDAHLSGFVMCLALKEQSIPTATLQHGLYRSDDSGSTMALSNFVADRIFLWDEITWAEFIGSGVDPSRIEIAGSYGFGQLGDRRLLPVDERLAFLCPSYHYHSVDDFIQLQQSLPSIFVVKYSLHPTLRQKFQHLSMQPMGAADPRPIVAICGDSAVIMHSLACDIPVITVGKRKMASVHLWLDQTHPSEKDWIYLIKRARQSLDEDRRRFGFPSHKEPTAQTRE